MEISPQRLIYYLLLTYICMRKILTLTFVYNDLHSKVIFYIPYKTSLVHHSCYIIGLKKSLIYKQRRREQKHSLRQANHQDLHQMFLAALYSKSRKIHRKYNLKFFENITKQIQNIYFFEFCVFSLLALPELDRICIKSFIP